MLEISPSVEMNVALSSGKTDTFGKLQELLNKKTQLEAEIAQRFKEELERVASSELYSTREPYIQAININDNVVTLDTSNFVVNMVEDGVSSYDMKCIIGPKTPIFTSKGRKAIKDITVGDLVLTHTGEYKKVTEVFKEKNTDDFVYEITIKDRPKFLHKIIVTGNHPILTNKGWISAYDIFLNEKDYRIIATAENCTYCGKLTYHDLSDKVIFCSNKCGYKHNNKDRIGNKRTDLSQSSLENISRAATQTNKRLYIEGKHASQPGNGLARIVKERSEKGEWGFQTYKPEDLQKVQLRAAQALGQKSRFTNPEEKIWPILEEMGFVRQYKFQRDKIKFYKNGKHRPRLFFFDFAHKELKICIEVNGEQWHTEEQDAARKLEVESKGWTYLSFWSKEIYRNFKGCVEEIERIYKNHNGEYQFIDVDFAINQIDIRNKKKNCTIYNNKYNMTVEDSHSFIANSIVTHNSGLLSSPKVKVNKQGKKYISVPISKYKQGRYNWRDRRTGRFDKGQNPGGKVEFRIVSENSDPSSWIHPGYVGKHLIERTMKDFDKTLSTLIDEKVNLIFNNM